jgi:hypothetical protein
MNNILRSFAFIEINLGGLIPFLGVIKFCTDLTGTLVIRCVWTAYIEENNA